MSEQPLIAVVDDEPPVRTMLRRALNVAHCDVATFGSAEELLQSLQSDPPACIILDVHLPGMSGLAARAHLCVAAPRIPVILITGSDDPSIDAQAAGAVRLLRKPFSMELLYAALSAALGRPVLRN